MDTYFKGLYLVLTELSNRDSNKLTLQEATYWMCLCGAYGVFDRHYKISLKDGDLYAHGFKKDFLTMHKMVPDAFPEKLSEDTVKSLALVRSVYARYNTFEWLKAVCFYYQALRMNVNDENIVRLFKDHDIDEKYIQPCSEVFTRMDTLERPSFLVRWLPGLQKLLDK